MILMYVNDLHYFLRCYSRNRGHIVPHVDLVEKKKKKKTIQLEYVLMRNIVPLNKVYVLVIIVMN